MKNDTSPEEILEEVARKRIRKIKRFVIHLFIYGVGLLVYISKTYWGAPLNFLPLGYINETVMWVWTFTVGIQGIQLLFKETVFGNNWEQKRIQKVLEKDKVEHKKWE